MIVFRHDAVFLQRCHAWVCHDICFEIKHTLNIAQSHVQHHAQTGWQRFQEPNVRARCCQVNVAHAFTTNFGLCDFNAALFANHTAVLETFVLTAQAFVIFDWAKNLGAKQTITLRLEGTVVNRFWFFDFAKRP